MNSLRTRALPLFFSLLALAFLPAHAQTILANGLEHFSGGASVINLTANGVTTYYGSNTGKFVAYKCDGTTWQTYDNTYGTASAGVNPQVGYNGYITVFRSANLAQLFSTNAGTGNAPDGLPTVVQVPVINTPSTTPAGGKCKTVTSTGSKVTATTSPGGLWAPYLFNDTFGTGAPMLYMYYSDHQPSTDIIHISAVNPSSVANIMTNSAWLDQGVSWNNAYDFAVYHSNKNSLAPGQVWDGVDPGHYYAFYAEPGVTYALQLDNPIKIDASTATKAGQPNPVTISSSNSGQAWEHWCNKESGANEAPQPFLSPNGSQLYVDYSANSYQSDYYAMGLLNFVNNDGTGSLSAAANWVKMTDPNGSGLPWFGPQATSNTKANGGTGYTDALCVNSNPFRIQQAVGPDDAFGNPTATFDGNGNQVTYALSAGNYIVSTGSNSMVYDTAGVLWNIYGATYHSGWTNNRELRMEPVLFTGQVPTWNQHPIPEGAPIPVAANGAGIADQPIFAIPAGSASATYHWYDRPAANPANLAYDPTAGPSSSSGYNGNIGEDQPGVYFSAPQTGSQSTPTTGDTTANPNGYWLNKITNTYVATETTELLWQVPNTNTTNAYTYDYAPYSYFIIQFQGAKIQVFGPTDGTSTGNASAWDDGIYDTNPNIPGATQSGTPLVLSNATAANNYEIYEHTFPINGLHTVMLGVQPQGLNAAINDNLANGNQPIQASDQTKNGVLSVSLGLSTFTLSVPAGTPSSSSTTLAVPANTYTTNSSVPLNATVTPATSGTVSFYDGATLLGTAISSATTGTAIFPATLAAGAHSLKAIFAGNSSYGTSTGLATLTISPATPTLTLTTTSANYNGATSVPLTVTISAAANSIAPTGAVTFYDSATALGTATFAYSAQAAGFVATCTATSQAATTHQYSAVLAADANYNTATSNTVAVLIHTNNVWVANGNGTVSAMTPTGTPITGSGLSGGGMGIAIDNTGNVWSLSQSTSKVAEYTAAGALISAGATVGGLNAPTALALDGAGLIWITNSNGTLTALTSPTTAVSAIPYAISASTPTSLSIDQAGNLWITNAGDNSLTEVIGAATPVTTPTVNAVTTNTLATKP